MALDDTSAEKLWEVSAKVFLFNADRTKILLAHDMANDGKYYTVIGGHIEHGETPEPALRREILEETGVEFDGPLTMVETQFQEFVSDHSGEHHKIYIIYASILDESTQLTPETVEGRINELVWVPISDTFSGEVQLYGLESAITKAMELLQ
jgi:ADP-ribose pyrophosphatase YjhB (NUDIX family)